MPRRSAERARIGKVSPRMTVEAVKVEVVVFAGEMKVEEIIENKPDEEKPLETEPNPVVAQGVYGVLEMSDDESDDLGKSVLKERDEGTSHSVAERSTTKSVKKFLQSKLRRCKDSVLDKRREEIFVALRLFQLQMKVNLIEVTDAVAPYSFRENEAEHQSFEAFCYQTQYFTQYLDFCDYLKNECKFIKHDSVPKEVYDSGELPLSRFNMLSKGTIIDLLQRYSYTLVSKSKAKETTDLEFEYSVYLTECDFIECDSDALAMWRILKEEKKFKDMKFSSLREDVLIKDLKEYIRYLSNIKSWPDEYWGETFSQINWYKIKIRNSVEKWPPVDQGENDSMLLVHRARSKTHTMDEDPLTEFRKLYPKLRDGEESFGSSDC